ncbi:MAG: aspartate kinase [Bacillota bacterium]
MGSKVAKFGGSSLSCAEQFRRVRDIVLGDPERVYVVPSAPGKRNGSDSKITDLLYLAESKAGRSGFESIFEQISQRYTDIVGELGLSLDINAHLALVRENLLTGAGPDYAASRGEYLNGIILADYLGYAFVDAAEVICFNEKGVFEPEKTQKAMAGRLQKSKPAVIPGFYGAMPDGSIKTFSRGGSDITGAIVSRAVQADIYENWTDVPGFLVADPRIVENPKVIEYITYKELRELSYMGATVLHEDAIFPVRQSGIPIHVRDTNAPAQKGTMIVKDLPKGYTPGAITGIAGRKGFTVIAIEKALMNAEVGFGRRVLWVLERHGVSFEHMPTGIDTLSLVISDTELNGKLDAVLTDLWAECNPDSIEALSNMSVIATVGQGMIRRVGIAAELFTALARSAVNVRMIDQGSSELNIIVGVENDDFENAVRAIYCAFVDK